MRVAFRSGLSIRIGYGVTWSHRVMAVFGSGQRDQGTVRVEHRDQGIVKTGV